MTYYVGDLNTKEESARRHCEYAVVYVHTQASLEVASFHRTEEAAFEAMRKRGNSFWGVANLKTSRLIFSLHS